MSNEPRRKIFKRPKNDLIYLFLRAGLRLARAIPLRAGLRLGAAIGAAAWRMLPRERRLSRLHLKVAFPEWTDAERDAVARESFRNLGRGFFELFHFDEILTTCGTAHPYVTFEGIEPVRAAFDRRRGGIFFTGHLGNWELMAAWFVAHTGLRGNEIVRKLYDPRIDRLLNQHRQRYNYSPLTRGGKELVEDIARVLSDNEMLGLLMDQDTNVRGVFVDWFGHPAWTPSGPAYLSYQADLDIMMMSIHRNPGGGHTVTIGPPLPRPHSGDAKEDIRLYTQMMTERLEAYVRTHPSEWVWMHRRWKTRPPGEPPEQNPAPMPVKARRVRRLVEAALAAAARRLSWETADKLGALVGRTPIDRLRQSLMDARFFDERTTIAGRPMLDAALAGGKGAVLQLTADGAGADIALWKLTSLGYAVHFVDRPNGDDFAASRLAWARRAHGVTPYRAEAFALAAARSLPAGALLAIAAEKGTNGEPSAASAQLATEHRAPLLRLAARRTGAGRFEVVVTPPS